MLDKEENPNGYPQRYRELKNVKNPSHLHWTYYESMTEQHQIAMQVSIHERLLATDDNACARAALCERKREKGSDTCKIVGDQWEKMEIIITM